MRIWVLLCATLPFGGIAGAAPPNESLPSGGYAYADLADMALAARMVLAAQIGEALPLRGPQAAGVPPGETRYYVTATVQALVKGQVSLPPSVTYLADLPDGPKGRPLKLKGAQVLLLATPAAGPGELRLVGPRAQVPRTAENEARLRAILTASVAPDAPPAIIGISRAFHVAGTLPGEGETQIFLRTADARPISLSVLRRPGEQPRWSVALSELTDDSAAPPAPDTLLWYRLACGLPATLPAEAVAGQDESDAATAADDYRIVLAGLGSCARG